MDIIIAHGGDPTVPAEVRDIVLHYIIWRSKGNNYRSDGDPTVPVEVRDIVLHYIIYIIWWSKEDNYRSWRRPLRPGCSKGYCITVYYMKK